MEFFNYQNESKIPKRQGVYSFFLNCITREKVGLIKNAEEEYSENQLKNAKRILIKNLSKIGKLYEFNDFIGNLQEVDKRLPGLEFLIHGKENSILQLVKIFEETKIKEIPVLVDLIQSTLLFQRPVYCGITKKQTLAMRYHQHKRDFFAEDKDNRFGYRLKTVGLDWDDVVFVCSPFQKSNGNFKELEYAEKYLMLTARPTLSVR